MANTAGPWTAPRHSFCPGTHYTGTVSTNLGIAHINFRVAETTRDFPDR